MEFLLVMLKQIFDFLIFVLLSVRFKLYSPTIYCLLHFYTFYINSLYININFTLILLH